MRRTGRPAKVPINVLDPILFEYVKFETTPMGEIVMRIIKNDNIVAIEITEDRGIPVGWKQVAYFRRRHGIYPCGDNHGGKREGAGKRKEEEKDDAEYNEVNGVIIDFAHTQAVELLHQRCVFTLSMDCKGQGLVSGDEKSKELTTVLKQVERADKNKKQEIIEENRELITSIIPEKRVDEMIHTYTDEYIDELCKDIDEIEGYGGWSAEDDFDDASTFLSAKRNRNGNITTRYIEY